jgi:hypothetical protein
MAGRKSAILATHMKERNCEWHVLSNRLNHCAHFRAPCRYESVLFDDRRYRMAFLAPNAATLWERGARGPSNVIDSHE